MSYQVLYRTYRPQKFSEVVGQDYIVKILKNAIKLDKIAHAYLFAGPRGTGKTTIAKLFARAINCPNFNEESCDECDSCKAIIEGNHPDIIELDAASNNGVDNIREIVEQVNYAPILGKYKVYIIDEAHMLSASAFNALLKTLEEPPTHVVFILATTDPEKIIPTVLSRCQRYNFSKISKFDMKKKMAEILKNEKIKYDDEALEEVAIMAEGGMRDALSILEQMLSYNPKGVYLKDVQKVFGLSTSEEKLNLMALIHSGKIAQAINSLREMYQAGLDPKRLAIDLLEIIKEALIYSDDARDDLLNKISRLQAIELLDKISTNVLLEDVKYLEEVLSNNRGKQNFISYLELCLIKMANNKNNRVIKEEKPVIKEEIKEEKVEVKNEEEPKKVETKKEVKKEIKIENSSDDLDYIASLLLAANKDEKINDAIIYNKLVMYKNEVDKRKFYELLVNTDLFASSADAIIVLADVIEASNINSKEIREELYNFLVNEFGIYKVIYAVDVNKRSDLIEKYKELAKGKKKAPIVEKPIVKKERTNEEKLKELFGDDLKVED